MTSKKPLPQVNHDLERGAVLCRAGDQFATQRDVDDIGVNLDLDRARVVLCVLSHLLGKGKSKTRAQLHSGIFGVVYMMRISVTRYGDTTPSPFPNLPLKGWPSGRSAFARLGITYLDLEEAWARGRDRADDACLPLEWILAFFPAMLWQPLATLIAWGPDIAEIRMQEAVRTMAQETTQHDKRRRPSGSHLSKGTIENRITGVWQLFDALLALRAHVAAAPRPTLSLGELSEWTRKPPRIKSAELGARDSEQDNSGPPIDACTKRLRELAQLARAKPDYLRQRRRLLLALLCLYGARVDAIRTTRVEDYLPSHRYPGGQDMPALRVFPGKTWDRAVPHYLPLPPILADWVTQWITSTGREVGQKDQPLFPSRNPATGATDVTFLGQAGFYSAIAGNPKGQWGSRALLPVGDDIHIGWHPHAFRHTAYQLAIRAAAAYQRENPDQFLHVHPEEFAKALAGHKLGGTVSATYRDLNREALTAALVPHAWNILYGDGALRHGVNPARIQTARTRRDALATTTAALAADIASNDAEADAIGRQAQAAKDVQRQLGLYARATHYSSQARAKRDTLEQHRRDLVDAEAEFLLAQEAIVALPDDLTEDDHQALLHQALGTPLSNSETHTDDLAHEITVNDAAELWDTTPQTINRWIRNGTPKNRPPLWANEAWHQVSQKDKRLAVDQINVDNLLPPQIKRLHQLRMRRAAYRD